MPFSLAAARPLFIAEAAVMGGAERSLLALSTSMNELGLDHYLLTYNHRLDFTLHAKHPLRVIELKPGGGVRSKVAALRRHFQERGPSRLKPLLSGYQPALHATLAGLRGFHCLMHDTSSLFGDQDSRSPIAKARIAVSNRTIGYGLRTGGSTMVNSEYLKTECRRDFGIEAVIVRMGGLAHTADPQAHPLHQQLRMLSVCRVEPNKRIDWMLRALAQYESEPQPLSATIDWRLDVAGKGASTESLIALAKSLGLADRVHFLGFVADRELESLYRQAHLFLMPAIQGYGIPAIESLHRGVPVLLHRESGVSDLLLDTPWATVFEGDEENMLAALQSAVRSILSGSHERVEPPSLPTESTWAAQIIRLCKWDL